MFFTCVNQNHLVRTDIWVISTLFLVFDDFESKFQGESLLTKAVAQGELRVASF